MLSFVPDQFLISPGQRPNELLPLHGAHLWYNFGHNFDILLLINFMVNKKYW